MKYYIQDDGKIFVVAPRDQKVPWSECRMDYKGTLGVQFRDESCLSCEKFDLLYKIEGDQLVMYRGYADGEVIRSVRATSVR